MHHDVEGLTKWMGVIYLASKQCWPTLAHLMKNFNQKWQDDTCQARSKINHDQAQEAINFYFVHFLRLFERGASLSVLTSILVWLEQSSQKQQAIEPCQKSKAQSHGNTFQSDEPTSSQINWHAHTHKKKEWAVAEVFWVVLMSFSGQSTQSPFSQNHLTAQFRTLCNLSWHHWKQHNLSRNTWHFTLGPSHWPASMPFANYSCVALDP